MSIFDVSIRRSFSISSVNIILYIIICIKLLSIMIFNDSLEYMLKINSCVFSEYDCNSISIIGISMDCCW